MSRNPAKRKTRQRRALLEGSAGAWEKKRSCRIAVGSSLGVYLDAFALAKLLAGQVNSSEHKTEASVHKIQTNIMNKLPNVFKNFRMRPRLAGCRGCEDRLCPGASGAQTFVSSLGRCGK